MKIRNWVTIIPAMFIALECPAATINVPGDFPGLASAISAASHGDEIVIAAGTYSGPFSITGKAITLRGAGAGLTLLTAPEGSTVLSISQVTAGAVSVEGLSVHGGRTSSNGAGVLITGATASFHSCRVFDNIAHRGVYCAWCHPVDICGGGMFITNNSQVTMDYCRIDTNRSSESFYAWGAGGQARGGGICVVGSALTMTHCELTANEANGNDYPPPANGNVVYGIGGGICAEAQASVILRHTTLDSNRIGGDSCWGGLGAGVAVMSSELLIESSRLLDNVTEVPRPVNRGGGVYIDGGSAHIIGSQLWGNRGQTAQQTEPGSAVYVASGAMSIATTSICSSGSQPMFGGWTDAGSVVMVSDCNELDCNADSLPDIEQIASGDLLDYDLNGIPDVCECLPDITGNRVVDGVDLAAVLGAWGTAGNGPFFTDINRDGIVNGEDLAFILGGWGPCLN